MFGSALLILLLLTEQDSVWSVRLVELRVPTHEREGGVALLGCQYDMEGETLYSVKWYKDSQEFYRYVPRSNPSIFYFPRPGISVNVARSSSTVVALVNLTRESAGLYTCEVSGEAPNFATVASQKYITIHLLPESGPHLTGLQEQYYLDDSLIANCTSSASQPVAHLKWLLNEKPVPMEHVRGPWYRVSTKRPDAVETILELRFTVKPSDFVDGAMRLKCQATIAPLYQRETNSTHYIALPFTLTTVTPNSLYYKDFAPTVKNAQFLLLLSLLILIIQ